MQGSKTFINETAVKIVDGALALTGGAGYRSTHPISRLYRDVRAGAFMHPLGANRAYEFVGRVALGREALGALTCAPPRSSSRACSRRRPRS